MFTIIKKCNYGKDYHGSPSKRWYWKKHYGRQSGIVLSGSIKVSLVDSDLQGSIYQVKDDFPGLAILSSEQISDTPYLNYDLVIVDTPPYFSNKLTELCQFLDFVLVPTKAGFFDIMDIRSTLALIKFSQAKNAQLKSGIDRIRYIAIIFNQNLTRKV